MHERDDVIPGRTGLESGAHTPLLWLLVPLMAGYALGGMFPGQLPPWPVFVLTAALALLAALFASKLGPRRAFAAWAVPFLLAVMLAGWTYYAKRVPVPPGLTGQANREATIDVKVTRLFALRSGGKKLSGLGVIESPPAWRTDLRGQPLYFHCWADDADGLGRGTVLRLRGKLEPVADTREGFEQYLRQQGCYLKLTQASLREVVAPTPALQRWFRQANEAWQGWLRDGANAPDQRRLAGIATAMLLGEKAALGAEERERFIASGTMHLFTVSGLHVGIVAGLLAFVLMPLRRVHPALPPALGLVLLWGYVGITGAAPAAVRAWWMAAFLWGALALMRKPAPLSALAASALIVLLIDPRELSSAGFQLSYSVVAGLLLYGVPLQDWLQHRFEPWRWVPEESLTRLQRIARGGLRWFWGLLAISFAAVVFSAPLIVAYFGVLAPGGFLLNVPLVALAPLALTASAGAVAAGALGWTGAAAFANHASWVFLAAMDALVAAFLKLPGSSLALQWRWDGAGGLLGVLLLAAAVCLAHRSVPARWRFGLPPALLLSGLVIASRLSQAPLS